MFILGIETSCDETASAVVIDGRKIASNVVVSQIKLHEKYGGIVPEIASRKHLEGIIPVVEEAIERASITIDDIDAIAVTKGPGLIGSLLVGISVAKALAYAKGIPIVGVNHIFGHISSVFLEFPEIRPPLIALVVSGGHTILFQMDESWRLEKIGQTRDDAAGEAFDKVARLLQLGYPGGIIIDKIADPEKADKIEFPRPLISSNSLDFSFSGLKTSVVHYLQEKTLPPLKKTDLCTIVSSFQEAVVDVLVEKSFRAARLYRASKILCTGGVAANSRLRTKMAERGKAEGIGIFFPSPDLCTDNAAMIAAAGYRLLKKGITETMKMNPFSRWED